jgi:glutamate dehydrogenase
MFEIWVYSPRVEGVHLRFGKVARGGLRWSDRREDFRTEVLGLVKAQMVKNAVIVPTGSKGGFLRQAAARPDRPTATRGWPRGIAAYDCSSPACSTSPTTGPGGRCPRQRRSVTTARPYLVVAADKGTATFSDIAPTFAQTYGFWLGRRFARGLAATDHKNHGLTARGAWESVKRHFREVGVNTQTRTSPSVGIGDMSGDVFGNGMLLSDTSGSSQRSTTDTSSSTPRRTRASSDAETPTAVRAAAVRRGRSTTGQRSRAGGGVFRPVRQVGAVSAEMVKALGAAEGDGRRSRRPS